jgi:monomeric isocitrate dehydrogenase
MYVWYRRHSPRATKLETAKRIAEAMEEYGATKRGTDCQVINIPPLYSSMKQDLALIKYKRATCHVIY